MYSDYKYVFESVVEVLFSNFDVNAAKMQRPGNYHPKRNICQGPAKHEWISCWLARQFVVRVAPKVTGWPQHKLQVVDRITHVENAHQGIG